MTQPDTSFGDLKKGQFAFYVDKGFDHGAFRSYFVQRDLEKKNSLSPDGRVIVPILFHEVTHFRKGAVIELMKYGESPKEYNVDSRYKVEA